MYLLQDQQRTSEPSASAFYPHEYGGIARDVKVTREGFARFFGWTPEELGFFELVLRGNDTFINDSGSDDWVDVYGYIDFSTERLAYQITIVDRSVRGSAKYVYQETEKLLRSYGSLTKVA